MELWCIKVDIIRFVVVPTSLDWVPNFDGTRWFLVLRLDRAPENELNRLLALSNRCLAVYGQPPLYDVSGPDRKHSLADGVYREDGRMVNEPKAANFLEQSRSVQGDFCSFFHISLAWTLEEPSIRERKTAARLDLSIIGKFHISFDNVKVKIGNIISDMQLSTKVHDEKSFLSA